MTTTIYLCTPPVAPFSCRFFAATPALVFAHMTTAHTGFTESQPLQGHTQAIAIAATLHQQYHTQGILVWAWMPCSIYFTSNIAAVAHLQAQSLRVGHADVAAITYQFGLAGLEEYVRAGYARKLVVQPVATQPAVVQQAVQHPPALLERHLAVNAGSAHRIVCIPTGTRTREELAHLMGAKEGDLDWCAGLVVGFVTVDGEAKGKVLRTDADVAWFVEVMTMGECWLGEGHRV